MTDSPRVREMEFTQDMADDAFLRPDDIAAAIWSLTQQPKPAWTFKLHVRPYVEKW